MKCVVTIANEIVNRTQVFQFDKASVSFLFVSEYIKHRPNHHQIIRTYPAMLARLRKGHVVLIATCAECKYYVHKIKKVQKIDRIK